MRILCFGDSNTWGLDASTQTRFDKRWPVVLQELLFDDTILEESLNGRTFHSHTSLIDKHKDGLASFHSSVKSHEPLDIVVIALGANDSKTKYNKSGEEIFLDSQEYVDFIKQEYPSTKILFVSPITITETKERVGQFVGSNEKITEFYSRVHESDIPILDMRDLQTGIDGLHITEESHAKIAQRVMDFISTNFIKR